MADLQKDDQTAPTQNGTLKISLPAVLEPPSESDMPTRTFTTSESKLSLPSNLCTPTSPLRLPSPMSLPTSPTPFSKSLHAEKPMGVQQASTLGKQPDPSPGLNSGSATGEYILYSYTYARD
ncbi:hypothetical protein O0L34_g444 [Tuta absoluta]|nr:hypothetical protein O0L34_g444 [Tuta absoluta]